MALAKTDLECGTDSNVANFKAYRLIARVLVHDLIVPQCTSVERIGPIVPRMTPQFPGFPSASFCRIQ